MTMREPYADRPVTQAFAAQWGWLVATGIGMLILGLFAAANILAATVATVLIVGVLMIVAGIGQIVVAFRANGWGGTLLWMLAGALYIVAGIFAFTNPLLASAVLTLVLAVSLFVGGVTRIAFGFSYRPDPGWGWLVAAGVLSVIVGVLIGLGWPANLWILGLFLALDLIAQGIALTSMGFALRSMRR